MNYFLGIFSVSSRECSSSNLAKNEKVKVDSKKSTFPQIHMKICVDCCICQKKVVLRTLPWRIIPPIFSTHDSPIPP